jgi:hypothetical protein
MLKRFLSGFISIMPFITRNKKSVNYFPDEIYKNDWKIIGNDLLKILRNLEKK